MVSGVTGLIGHILERPLDFIVGGLARWGIRPNVLTLAGLVLNLVAAGTLYLGRFRWAAALILMANLLDVFDGRLARRTGQVSPFGAFLDSVVDRYADLTLMSALWLYYSRSHDHWMLFIVGLAVIGSVMTSYTRARAECIISSCKVGFFERPERIAMLVLGAFLDRMPQALLIVAIFANLTGVQRIVYTWRVLSAPEKTL
ncbi:CDP-diacylglycerol--inositol 3-phosphatidyltransferase [bacterium HR11]|nr:CDP-diacylglycerol--inositol 3-phosphatidyltransferase [bacterium HR11]